MLSRGTFDRAIALVGKLEGEEQVADGEIGVYLKWLSGKAISERCGGCSCSVEPSIVGGREYLRREN